MALSDEQIVLKAFEVAERRGWSFIMETMLDSSSTKRARGLWGQQSESNSVMPSQESEEDDDDVVPNIPPSEQKMERPSWRQLVTHQKQTPFSFSKALSLLGKGEDVQLKIKLFIDKTTKTFNDCFFSEKVDYEILGTDSVSCTAESSVDVQTQTPVWDTHPTPAVQNTEGSHVNAQTQTPVWDKRPTVVGKRSGTVVKRPSSARSTGVSSVHAQTQTDEYTVPSPVTDPTEVDVPKVGSLERESVTSPAITVPWLRPAVFRSTFPLVALARPIHPAEEFPWSLSLAAHVPKKLRIAVVSLQFFDMFHLLPDVGNDVLHPFQRTFERWQSAFAIMGSILLEDVPEKMTGFFNYCETIRKAHEHLPEGAWLDYDVQFRQLKEVEPYISWAVIHPQLWPHIVKPAAPLSEEEASGTMYDKDVGNSFQLGVCANCGGEHLEEMCPELDPDAEEHELPVPLGIPRKETDYCFAYNTDRCDKGQRCNFNHLCSNCDGTHPEFACPRLVPNIEEELGLADFEPQVAPPKKVKTGYCFLYNEDQCSKGSDCFLCHVCANCGGEHPKLRCPILNPDAVLPRLAFSDPQKHSPKKVKTGYCFLYNEDKCSKGKDCFLCHVCADCGGEHPKVRCPQVNSDYAAYELEPKMWSTKVANHRDDPSGMKRSRLIPGREVDELSYLDHNMGFTEQARRLDDPKIMNWPHLNADREVRKPPFPEPRMYSTRTGNDLDEDSIVNWRQWNPDREVHKRPYLEPNVGFAEQAIRRDEPSIETWRQWNPEREVHKMPYMEPSVGFPEQANRRDDPQMGNWPQVNPDREVHKQPFLEPRVLSTYSSDRRDESPMEKWPQLNPDRDIHNLELMDPQGASLKKAKTGYCFRYNKDECTDGENCSFNHICAKCSGDHPKVKCPQLNAAGELSEVALQGLSAVWEEIKESSRSQYNTGTRDMGNRFNNLCSICGEAHPNVKCPRRYPASESAESKRHPGYESVVKDHMAMPLQGRPPLYTQFE